MTAIEHPAWCDRSLCTAPATPPRSLDERAVGQHESAPVHGGAIVAQLYHPVMPWESQTWLRLTDERRSGNHLEIALDRAPEAVAMLIRLVGAAAQDSAPAAAGLTPATRKRESPFPLGGIRHHGSHDHD